MPIQPSFHLLITQFRIKFLLAPKSRLLIQKAPYHKIVQLLQFIKMLSFQYLVP